MTDFLRVGWVIASFLVANFLGIFGLKVRNEVYAYKHLRSFTLPWSNEFSRSFC